MESRLFARLLFCLFLILIFATSTHAGDIPRYTLGGSVIHGGSADFSKAGGDTINLMAGHHDPTNGPGEPAYYGDFEDAEGNPAWNGWTSYDVTEPTQSNWNVSNYNQVDPDNYAAWCGDINIAACDSNDAVGGYGNNWHDIIGFNYPVPYPALSTQVGITATLQYDCEPGYDAAYLSYQYNGQPYGDLQIWDGIGTAAVNSSVSYLPTDYLGGTEVAICFRFKSDGGWSDEDCSYPTAGAMQVDDINVQLVNGDFTADFFEDFQHGGDPTDFGLWGVRFPNGVGDFANIWTGLQDVDPCKTNYGPQVAFIDDGFVVLGTGGSDCINWCYGPGGYIVNTTGGLAGPTEHLHNVIESPVMDWPAPKSGVGPDDNGIIMAFDVFRHEDLSADAPGVFYTWGVRSADIDGSAGEGIQDIAEQGWRDRHFVQYGGPGYYRSNDDVSDLMNAGRDEFQVQLGVYELGWVWYWTGNDGYPAPYFDNVTVKVFPQIGPGMSARELDLAQDNFPARGSIDHEDLGSHSVRFDAANNVALAADLCNCPGDSIIVDIAPLRSGAAFDGNPRLHYIVDRNTIFDPYRTSGLPAQGSVFGQPAVGSSGSVTPHRWAFDLPDTGFLFPGDVLHYFISATDAIGGVGGSDPQTSLMPADTTGFSTGFGYALGYNSTFTVRALPTLRADGSTPDILFINDFANRGGEDEWHIALHHIGFLPGEDYDTYYVNGPSSGVGNGIGGRANALMLEGYSEILYTSGDLGVNTISNGDYQNDAGDDVGTLLSWLNQGGKDLFLTGDDLASDLGQAGTETLNLLENYLGLTVVTNDIRSTIDNQVAPLVRVVPGNPVFAGYLDSWIAYGGCQAINTFDGVRTIGSAQVLAEFTDPSGAGGAYDYSAATLNIINPGPDQMRVISMPVDLMSIYTDPAGNSSSHLPDRADLLHDVLQYFGQVAFSDPSPVALPGITFAVGNHPNPFNPSTTIQYSLPRAGHLKLSIFNIRGQLVKTLVNGNRPAGENQTVVWDGTDNLGSAAASGVYFYEARSSGDVRIGKMTLVK